MLNHEYLESLHETAGNFNHSEIISLGSQYRDTAVQPPLYVHCPRLVKAGTERAFGAGYVGWAQPHSGELGAAQPRGHAVSRPSWAVPEDNGHWGRWPVAWPFCWHLSPVTSVPCHPPAVGSQVGGGPTQRPHLGKETDFKIRSSWGRFQPFPSSGHLGTLPWA